MAKLPVAMASTSCQVGRPPPSLVRRPVYTRRAARARAAAGYDGALALEGATLGEEVLDPARTIPRAVIATLSFTLARLLVCTEATQA